MKTYHSYQAELRQAESKLRSAEMHRSKMEQTLSQDKLDRSKKYKLTEKEVMKVKALPEFGRNPEYLRVPFLAQKQIHRCKVEGSES